jgi:hypothetical protein
MLSDVNRCVLLPRRFSTDRCGNKHMDNNSYEYVDSGRLRLQPDKSTTAVNGIIIIIRIIFVDWATPGL